MRPESITSTSAPSLRYLATSAKTPSVAGLDKTTASLLAEEYSAALTTSPTARGGGVPEVYLHCITHNSPFFTPSTSAPLSPEPPTRRTSEKPRWSNNRAVSRSKACQGPQRRR